MLSGSRKRVALSVLFVLFLVFSTPFLLFSATYYVDPVAGNDNNTGLTQALAWQHVPGTYKLDNTGFLFQPGSPAGWVTINAGDVIKIRSGTTVNNRLVIDSNWYGSGTSSSPIVIARDDTWDAGPVVFDGSQQTLGPYDPLVFVWSRDYVQIDGVATNGIVIQNANGRGFQGTGTSESVKMKGLSVKNMKLFNNVKFNVYLQRCDSFRMENIDIDGNKQDGNESGGFQIGDNTYGCSNGVVVNCRSYNNGAVPGSQGGGTDARIGFWLTNSTNITYQNCVSHDNAGNGYDVGVVGTPPSVRTDAIKYINCESYNNGNGFSGNLDNISGTSRFWYVNCIARDNATAGWILYNGPSAYVYNSLTARNRFGMYIDAPSYALRNTVVQVKNTIFYRNSSPGTGTYPWDIWIHRSADLQLISDYNHFEQGDQTTCIAWNGAVVWDPYFYDTTSAPGSTLRTWYRNHSQDAHSLCTVDGEYANFLYPGANDFHLTATSSLIDKGTIITNSLVPELQYDKDGIARPRTGPWDIGPYQYVPVPCTFSISPTSQSFSGTGGTGSVSVNATAGCPWSASSNNSWIKVTSGASGTGSGAVGYSVDPNTGTARTGSITIAGQSFTVSQDAAGCSYSLSPTSQSFTTSGGTGSANVTATAGCPWSASSNSSWIKVTSGASGTGSGSVAYSVDPNNGAARTGTITIAGQTFAVNQAGTGIPNISVSPLSINFSAVRRGQSKSSTVTVSNTGPGTLTVASVTITGTNPGDYRQTNNCSFLAQGASCKITATFAPRSIGTKRASIAISSNDPDQSTVNVTLRGIGY